MLNYIERAFEIADEEGKNFAASVIELMELDDVERAFENEELTEFISYEVEAYMIYDDDKWELMKEYCDPEEANYNDAREKAIDDIENYLRIARRER